jgi:hypothetical protein
MDKGGGALCAHARISLAGEQLLGIKNAVGSNSGPLEKLETTHFRQHHLPKFIFQPNA